METNNFPNKSDSAIGATANMAGRVGTAAANVLDATKAAGKQIGAVANEEMTNLKADLDDLISRLPSFSEIGRASCRERV